MTDSSDAVAGTDDGRLETLELKMMELEHTVSELNAVIIQQYEQIDLLKQGHEQLLDRLADMSNGPDSDPATEPPPPHY